MAVIRVTALLAVLSLVACGEPETFVAASGESRSAEQAAAETAAVHQHDSPTPTPLVDPQPAVPVIEQELAYGESGNSNLIGFLAMPEDAAEPLPGVIMIHEWWGLNDNIKSMARRLAGEGYVVLAVDLYGGEVAEDPARAQALMGALLTERDAARNNIRQAYQYLDRYALAPTIGSVGWCLGGAWSLQAALMLPRELDAMVMYYGEVTGDPAQISELQMPILGLFAEEDTTIAAADVTAFREALHAAGKSAEITIYPGVDHAFANPSGGNYDAAAAADAWAKTVSFLSENLKPSEQG